MTRAKGPERIERIVGLLRSWQALEREAINTTAEIMEQTDNALIRQIMEIIRNDSVQHHRVQQFLIDSMTKKAITLAPEDLAEIDVLLIRIDSYNTSDVLLMPQAVTPEEMIERGRWIVDICKQRGFRYCPRLHISLYGNVRGK